MAADPEAAFFGTKLEDPGETDTIGLAMSLSESDIQQIVVRSNVEYATVRTVLDHLCLLRKAPADSYRSPATARRAVRRLSDTKPSDFERVIDMFYTWREQRPSMALMDMVRVLTNQNHNVGDNAAVLAMEGLVKEARLAKITAAVNRLGLDDAERLLGLKEE